MPGARPAKQPSRLQRRMMPLLEGSHGNENAPPHRALIGRRLRRAALFPSGPRAVLAAGAEAGRARAPWERSTKALPCPSPPTATRPSSEGLPTTVALGPRGSGRGAAASGPSRDPSWSARAPWGPLTKAAPCPSPPTATRPSSEGLTTTATLGPRGSGRGAEASGPSRDPSSSARAPWGTLNKAFPCPSPPTATRPSSEGPTTTVALGPRGSGRGAEVSGPSREPSWSARAPWGPPNKAAPCPSPPTATRPSSEGTATTAGAGAAWVWTRSGGVWTQQGAKLVGSGAVGNAQQGYSVSLSADGNTAIVGGHCDNSSAGAAWVWTRSGGVWTQQGPKLVGSGAVGTARPRHFRVPLRRRQHGHRRRVERQQQRWGRVGLDEERRCLDPAGSQAGRLGRRGEPLTQGSSVSLSADGNTAIVGGDGDNSGAGAAWVFAIYPEPAGLVEDAHATGSTISNLNGVLEPGETVLVETGWRNTGAADATFTGSSPSFTGPSGATYGLDDAAADYGTIAAGASANCLTATETPETAHSPSRTRRRARSRTGTRCSRKTCRSPPPRPGCSTSARAFRTCRPRSSSTARSRRSCTPESPRGARRPRIAPGIR